MDAPWAETRAGSGRPHASSLGAVTNQHLETPYGFRSNRTFVLPPHYPALSRDVGVYVHHAWVRTIGADNICGACLMFLRVHTAIASTLFGRNKNSFHAQPVVVDNN